MAPTETAGTLIDSSVRIAVERGLIDLAALGDADDDQPLGIAAITASELLHGGHRTIGEGDLMIGATAGWLDHRVATRDLRSFPKIKGLPVVRW